MAPEANIIIVLIKSRADCMTVCLFRHLSNCRTSAKAKFNLSM